MNSDDRNQLLDALDREGQSSQDRILASLDSFRNWLMFISSVLYRKLRNDLKKVWNWIRNI